MLKQKFFSKEFKQTKTLRLCFDIRLIFFFSFFLLFLLYPLFHSQEPLFAQIDEAIYPLNGDLNDAITNGRDLIVTGQRPYYFTWDVGKFHNGGRIFSDESFPTTLRNQPSKSLTALSQTTFGLWVKTPTDFSFSRIGRPQYVLSLCQNLSEGLCQEAAWLAQRSGLYFIRKDGGQLNVGCNIFTDHSVGLETPWTPDDQWHHLSCRYDGTSVSLFVDGALKKTAPHRSIIPETYWYGVNFGSAIPTKAYHFDDMFIRSEALEDEQINFIFTSNEPYTGEFVPPVTTIDVAVILAEPSDRPHKAEHDKSYYANIADQVREYYLENSYQSLELNFIDESGNYTIFDNNGDWYRVTKPNEPEKAKEAYYGAVAGNSDGENEFVRDVIPLTDIEIVNGKPLNYDKVLIIHSGETYQIAKKPGLMETLAGLAGAFALLGENDLVGPWVHEIGHLLGADDVYNKGHTGQKGKSTVGSWGLMTGGPANNGGLSPPHMISFTKETLKWLNYDLCSLGGECRIYALSTQKLHDKAYRYLLKDDASEYYILEVRNKAEQYSQWDRSVPETAAVLYHVEKNGKIINIPPVVKDFYGEEFNNGVLSPPLLGIPRESYRDFDNMIKFTPVEITETEPGYQLDIEIEALPLESFEHRFHQSVLKPFIAPALEKAFEIFKLIAPEYPIDLPDLDLHVYTDDGKHVGVNYETGEYEVQIPGAITSGDLGNGTEYILIPEEITNYHFVVSSKDYQVFFEEFPEIAEEIENKTADYEVYARYIDPEIGIFNSSTITQNIEPGIELEHIVTGTMDVSVSEGEIFDNIAPTTSVSLEGTMGENEWFTSDVLVSLFAVDNEGGVGVEKTEYYIDYLNERLNPISGNIQNNSLVKGLAIKLFNSIISPVQAIAIFPNDSVVRAIIQNIKSIPESSITKSWPGFIYGDAEYRVLEIKILDSRDVGNENNSTKGYVGEQLDVTIDVKEIEELKIGDEIVANVSLIGDEHGAEFFAENILQEGEALWQNIGRITGIVILLVLLYLGFWLIKLTRKKQKPKIAKVLSITIITILLLLALIGLVFILSTTIVGAVSATENPQNNSNQWQTYTQPFTIIEEGIHTVYYRSVDNAGNIEETRSIEIKIDKTAPEITVPVFKESYIYKQPLVIEFSATDTISGIFRVSATLNNQLITSGQEIILDQLGTNVFTLTATDYAGHTTAETKEFKVFYDFSDFLPPLQQDKTYNLGRDLPVKFQLKDYQGNYIADIQPLIYISEIINGILQPEQSAVSSGKANLDNIARYDLDKNQYVETSEKVVYFDLVSGFNPHFN